MRLQLSWSRWQIQLTSKMFLKCWGSDYVCGLTFVTVCRETSARMRMEKDCSEMGERLKQYENLETKDGSGDLLLQVTMYGVSTPLF